MTHLDNFVTTRWAQPRCDARVILTPWTRAHRRIIQHWPAPADIPVAWLLTGSTGGLRESWAIVHFEAGLIGRLTLRDIDLDLAEARIGIYLHPGYLGQGYGSEALRLFVAQERRFVLLRIDVAEDNTIARRCYERCGFTEQQRFMRNQTVFLEMTRCIP